MTRKDYFRSLDFLEVDATFQEPPRDPILRRWRTETNAGNGFGVVAWQLVTHDASAPSYERLTTPLPAEARLRVGSFQDTPEVRQAWQRTLASARAVSAEVILFQTPPAFSPVERHREAMRRFFGEIVGERSELVLAWEPRGVWEPGEAGRLAEELGLLYACDPLQLEGPPPPSDLAYFRLLGLGLHRNRVTEDQMDLLAELVDEYERCWVVFANHDKHPDARRFRRLLLGRASDTD